MRRKEIVLKLNGWSIDNNNEEEQNKCANMKKLVNC